MLRNSRSANLAKFPGAGSPRGDVCGGAASDFGERAMGASRSPRGRSLKSASVISDTLWRTGRKTASPAPVSENPLGLRWTGWVACSFCDDPGGEPLVIPTRCRDSQGTLHEPEGQAFFVLFEIPAPRLIGVVADPEPHHLLSQESCDHAEGPAVAAGVRRDRTARAGEDVTPHVRVDTDESAAYGWEQFALRPAVEHRVAQERTVPAQHVARGGQDAAVAAQVPVGPSLAHGWSSAAKKRPLAHRHAASKIGDPGHVRALADEAQRAAQLKIGHGHYRRARGRGVRPGGRGYRRAWSGGGIAERAVGVAGLARRPTFAAVRGTNRHPRLF